MLLSFTGVQKRFGSTIALQGVTAQVDGRAIGLLGPNGAGKTTLMRICLGLIKPTAGEVRVFGIDAVADPGAVRRRLGYAAEGPGRIPGLSGLESVAYAAELCGVRHRDAMLRAHDMLDLVGLDESRYRNVEEYSTGMHQRVKIAMALVHDPDMVLLDEPTSGLDPESRDELLDLIVHLRDSGGPAVLLSTHLLHDVERTCDTCVIMQDGQVRFAGLLADLQRPHASEYAVRLSKPNPAFVEALAQRGAQVKPDERPDAMTVCLPDATNTTLIWETARVTDASVLHLEPRAATLEDAFMATIHHQGGHR